MDVHLANRVFWRDSQGSPKGPGEGVEVFRTDRAIDLPLLAFSNLFPSQNTDDPGILSFPASAAIPLPLTLSSQVQF